MKIGACGIACEVCELYDKKICQGCSQGNDPSAVERLEFMKSCNVMCPVFNCAVEKGVSYCQVGCSEFPCKIYEGEFPYSRGFLQMHKQRIKERR